MDLIYAQGEASISQVLADLPNPPMREHCGRCLRIMEKKGSIFTRREEGREIFYRPTQRRGRAARSALGRVLDVFYNGSLEKSGRGPSQRSRAAAKKTEPSRPAALAGSDRAGKAERGLT